MHSNRNLKEFAKSEEVGYKTIRNNSSKWNWNERALIWDKHQSEKLYKQIDDLFENLNKQGLNDMTAFIKTLNLLRDDAIERFKRQEINSTTCLKIMKNYIDCYRQATEHYYINCRKNIIPPADETHSNINPLNNLGQMLIESEKRIRSDTL